MRVQAQGGKSSLTWPWPWPKSRRFCLRSAVLCLLSLLFASAFVRTKSHGFVGGPRASAPSASPLREGMLDIPIPDMRGVLGKPFDTDKIYEFDNFLSKEDCEALIAYARDKVKDSMVVCANGVDCPNPARTSRNTFVSDDDHPVSRKISARVEEAIGISQKHFEDLQVVHYTKDQHYKEHFDACNGNHLKDCDGDVKTAGQRYATFIIYLNDDFAGGETCFPRRKRPDGKCEDPDAFKVRPKQGKAALFFNLMPDNITAKPESLHAGLPPSSGEKWMCNKWVRTRPWRPRATT